MIITNITFNNIEANQRITNLILQEQNVSIQINTNVLLDKRSYVEVSDYMTASIWLNNEVVVGGVTLFPRTNLNTLNTPVFTQNKLLGNFFIYSIHTTRLPRYTDFGDGNIYKFFYTNYMNFNDHEFIKQLNSYFRS